MGVTPSRRPLGQWLLWFGVLLLVSALLLTLRARLDKAHVALAFLLVVLGGSSAGGRVLGLSLAGMAFLTFNVLFLPPYNTLAIGNPLDWLVLFAFLVTSVVAAQLLENQREEAAIARQRTEEIDRLSTLGAETLNAARAEDALDAIATVIRGAMGTDRCEIYLRHGPDALVAVGHSPDGVAQGERKEGNLLQYVVEQGRAAVVHSDGTLTVIDNPLRADVAAGPPVALADLTAIGIPLAVRDRVVGALRLWSARAFSLSDDQRRVLGALAYYAALGAERVRLVRAAEEAESLRRADRLKDALLASVSHDLRTPLTAIKGIANEIWQGGDSMRAFTIEQEADRLTVIVNDLLELSQINAGALRVDTALNTADDVVGAAIERVEAVHGAARIAVQIDSDGEILVGRFDFSHTMRALTNLLENAIKYSPAGAPVTLHVWRAGARLRFVVEDRGAGVAPGNEERIFEPFYRGVRVADGVRGTGLGLSIARRLAEAQGGALTYLPRDGGGSQFVLELPAADAPRG
jgi:two-component system sensor histidine kinase KdpD